MTVPRKFLVIDDNADSRFLLTKTLLRKFPQAVLIECGDDGTALVVARTERVQAIVVHRTHGVSGVDMVRELRAAAPLVPIVLVSGFDRSAEALEAGASYFMPYEEWLRIGTVVAGLLTLCPADPAAARQDDEGRLEITA